jgi:hypothetical protein
MVSSFSMESFTALGELNRFNDIKFIESTHEYFHQVPNTEYSVAPIREHKFTSVTTFIKQITPTFNQDYWLAYKTLESMGLKVESHSKQNVPQEFIKINGELVHYKTLKVDTSTLAAEWKNKSTTALSNGTAVHREMELAFQGKYLSDLSWKYAQNNKHLFQLRGEFIVADYDKKIAGQMDALFFNTLTDQFELHDYKTDKKIEYTNRFESLLPPLDFMSNCNFNKYTIQLNMYKHCIEKYTDIKIGVMKIVHIGQEIEIIEIPDCPDIINMLLK